MGCCMGAASGFQLNLSRASNNDTNITNEARVFVSQDPGILEVDSIVLAHTIGGCGAARK